MSSLSYFEGVLQKALDAGASDIHIAPGSYIGFRIQGGIQFDKHLSIPTPGLIHSIVKELLSSSQYEYYEKGNELDIEIISQKGARFRANVFQDRSGDNITLRILSQMQRSFDELRLPQVLKEWVDRAHGLVLIAGSTGSGKTTTRSALIEYINTEETRHILVLEDVIEHIYENKRSLIHQRRIGHDGHARSYAQAIGAAMREDPDVIAVGDLRDSKSIEIALGAAQTGHLVIGEIHASTTYHALSRIISSFSKDEQLVARELLAQQFIGSIAQRLVTDYKTGERVLKYEILEGSIAVRTALRKNSLQTLADIVQMNRVEGSVPLDDVLK